MDAIRIVDQFHYHTQVVFGLDVQSDNNQWPRVVGCSLLSQAGDIHDLPARWLRSAGLALWDIKMTTALAEFCTDPGEPGGYMRAYGGRIMFALWPDNAFRTRLADTGWVPWEATSMVGASAAGFDAQDQYIESKYGGRLDAWAQQA
ncbi:hypothetical protein [Geodermatophilus sp. URMC 65]